MTSRARQIRVQLHQLLDACLFALAFSLAYLLRADELVMELFGLPPPSPFSHYVWLYLILIPAAPLLLEANGFYDRPLLGPRKGVVWPLFKGCALTTVVLILAVFFLRLTLARSVIVWFGVISFGLVLLKEEALRLLYQAKFTRAQLKRPFLLVGTTGGLERFRERFKVKPEDEIEIVAEVNLDQKSLSSFIELMHEHAANGVIIAISNGDMRLAEAVVRACETEGVEAWLMLDFLSPQISRPSFDSFYGHPVMVFRSTPEPSWQSVAKQVIDFVGAAVLLVLLLPVFAVIALLIKLTSPGPVLFKQLRCGLNGKPFTMYKFRTMVTDAEQRKQELAVFNEMSGPVFKMTNDPRVTPIGRFLRKYSLDELPQLYNVLRGEMSLVGPRPLPVAEVKCFDELSHRRRLSVKPGLTCLWQIKGRNKIVDFKEWVRLDLEYIDNWSLWLDLKILLGTIPAVLRAEGAK
ncbi:MAG: sugar transferase [Verrucomicrobiae bacterium]|nr:sugar transferase [Verrucomicrobiae bacterium]